MPHIQLSQDVFRPGRILLFAPLALQVLCGEVIPPIYVQDLAHSAVEASSSQFVVTAGQLDTDKWNGPHLQWHPKKKRAAEKEVRRGGRLGVDERWLGRIPPELQLWDQVWLSCFGTGSEQSLPDPVLLEMRKVLVPVDRELSWRLEHWLRSPHGWRCRGRSL